MKTQLIAASLLCLGMSVNAQTAVTIDMSSDIAHVPSLIYGAGAEDVNHEIYGGLYDQRIFGESFEEPAVSLFAGASTFDSPWSLEGDILRVRTSGHGKIVFTAGAERNNTASVDMRIDAPAAISGFIINVSDAGDGADAFNGYEVGLNAEKKVLVVGKHQHNWQPIAEVPVEFKATDWNNISVAFDGASAVIHLNGKEVYRFEDSNNALLGGAVGLRSYNGTASFRNLKVNNSDVAFDARPVGIRGFRHFDYPWALEGERLYTLTPGHAKIIYYSDEMSKGSAQVELRHDADRAITGFIFDVSEAAAGADNFRGYEVSLNAASRVLVIGKHDHNWQSIAEVPVSFEPSSWNTLRLDFDGDKFSVSLNGQSVYEGVDSDNPLLSGRVGLRTFDGPASFRNFTVNGKQPQLEQMPVGVSSMWEPVGKATFSHISEGAAHGTYFQQIDGSADAGIANYGLNKWGIGIQSGKTMSGTLRLRGTVPDAYVALQSVDGSREYARYSIDNVGADWTKFEFDLTPDTTDPEARFVVELGSDGELDVDMVLLHTDTYPYRSDITDAFRAEGLTFLRYGGTMINAAEYMTGNMMGPRDERPPYTGFWYTHSTNGFGIIEFVEFARMIGTEPTFSINIEDNPTDVLALLKVLEPYDLHYIEIGNEENIGDDSWAAYEHYVERFNVLYDAIHPVYPELVFINAAWWRPDREDLMEYVFHALDGKSLLWDHHPWTETPAQGRDVETQLNTMKRLFTKWNPDTDMHVAILEENGNTHDMNRALAHATVLNVVRKMNGFVELDSPANALEPYLQNDNGWNQGQIFFNSSTVWGQPPYYAQQMASAAHLPIVASATFRNPGLNICATRSEDGSKLAVHIVNSASSSTAISFNLKNGGEFKSGKAVSLSGNPGDRNTPREPSRIIPKESVLSEARLSVEPNSYTVVEIELNVPDAVVAPELSDTKNATFYHLDGTKASEPYKGVCVSENGEKVLF